MQISPCNTEKQESQKQERKCDVFPNSDNC